MFPLDNCFVSLQFVALGLLTVIAAAKLIYALSWNQLGTREINWEHDTHKILWQIVTIEQRNKLGKLTTKIWPSLHIEKSFSFHFQCLSYGFDNFVSGRFIRLWFNYILEGANAIGATLSLLPTSLVGLLLHCIVRNKHSVKVSTIMSTAQKRQFKHKCWESVSAEKKTFSHSHWSFCQSTGLQFIYTMIKNQKKERNNDQWTRKTILGSKQPIPVIIFVLFRDQLKISFQSRVYG